MKSVYQDSTVAAVIGVISASLLVVLDEGAMSFG